jgi:beta-phosphoglucomutase-like phosphatase (HAD superfamily)
MLACRCEPSIIHMSAFAVPCGAGLRARAAPSLRAPRAGTSPRLPAAPLPQQMRPADAPLQQPRAARRPRATTPLPPAAVFLPPGGAPPPPPPDHDVEDDVDVVFVVDKDEENDMEPAADSSSSNNNSSSKYYVKGTSPDPVSSTSQLPLRPEQQQQPQQKQKELYYARIGRARRAAAAAATASSSSSSSRGGAEASGSASESSSTSAGATSSSSGSSSGNNNTSNTSDQAASRANGGTMDGWNRSSTSSSIDRVLEGTDPGVETWVDRNRRRSLVTLRGRSELSLGADELNESMRPGHLDKHRFVLHPDEAFGAIFAWDVVFNNSRALELKAWQAVAEEAGLAPPDMDDILRAEAMAPEAAIHRVFYWTADWGEIKRLHFRKCEIYNVMQDTWQFTLSPGIKTWLATLDRYGIKSVLCAPRPRAKVEAIVKQVALEEFFTNSQLVTADDEFESLEQMLLIASIKLERPPRKCVVFTDKPDGITASREVSARVVALVGAHPAYEIKSADSTVSSFSDLVVYHVRSLFAQEGLEFMDPETEMEQRTE